MRTGPILAAALLAAALLAPGPAAAAPFDFSCAAPLGNGSQMIQVQPGPTYRVRGRITPGALEQIQDPALPAGTVREDVAFTTRAAEILIKALEGGPSVALAVVPRYSSAGRETTADLIVQTVIDGVDSERALGTLGSHRGIVWDELRFDIEVREDRVIVEAGGRRRELAMAIGRGARIYISCVGGVFDFEGVDWGG